MMFAARCVGISLAMFILLYVPLSLAVSRGWKFSLRAVKSGTARGSADLLFVLRVLPFVVALAFTFVFTLPSFLLSTVLFLGPALLAWLLTAFRPDLLEMISPQMVAGIIKAVSAQRRTSRALMKWLDGSIVMEPAAGVPVYRTGKDSPTLTVAGVREPKVLVSEAAVAALTASELRTALKHEMAHVRFYDNLKKLFFRFCAFPGMTALEHAWSEQSELAADDAAVACIGDALDLAAALIKVSRLAPAQPTAELATGLLHSSTALSVRIQRLFLWEARPSPARSWNFWYALPPAAATGLVVATTYSSALAQLHVLTEWLVR